jgi:hypothetical protein
MLSELTSEHAAPRVSGHGLGSSFTVVAKPQRRLARNALGAATAVRLPSNQPPGNHADDWRQS